MLEGKLEGASVFRETCKILCNLLAFQFSEEDDADEEEETTLREEDNRKNDPASSKKSSVRVDKSKKLTARTQANNNDPRFVLFQKRMQSFENFCSYLDLPHFFAELIKQLLNDKSNSKIAKEARKLETHQL